MIALFGQSEKRTTMRNSQLSRIARSGSICASGLGGRMRLLAAICAAALLSGCSSGYSKFYQPVDYTGQTIVPEPVMGATPSVQVSTGDPLKDVLIAFRDGYSPLGQASFNGPQEGARGAVGQAKKVGATRIIMSAEYASTISGTLPITTPTTTTTYSNGTAQIFGYGGSASGTYSGTTTTYGSQTNYVPYSVDRYDQSAIFLAPIPRKGYGLRVRPLDLDEARRYGTNRGLVVVAIRTGSPGFLSDILPGDVILQVNGRPVYDLASYNAAMPWGQALDLEIRRDGVVIRKSLQIRPTGEWPTG
ncbi:PDZ domain-containing protein [Phenylobacterium sp. NIBR 498073]|uniref:PDZ domain-containing protein n=1 Tax=Phenylobacterium sp. NIBR 498073 TaxID=3015177 RepID=UPI0022B43FC2|nr:PDZ domain-containing protein [Phenylobacterium sp. NIBR 498073]WGU40345.1 PDZ domain-containing protein [Phenylobacterium sp. NIBR 498073]